MIASRRAKMSEPLKLDQDGQPPRAINAARNAVKAMNQMYGLIEGMLADHKLTTEEIQCLTDWLCRHNEVLNEWPISIIAAKVAEILDDGVVSEVETKELTELLLNTLGRAAGEVESDSASTQLAIDAGLPALEFANRSFCFTGKFQHGDRKTCQRMTVERGGVIHSTVTLKLDFLVIGALASRDWAHSSHGRKIEAAVRNKSKGATTLIVSEQHWSACLVSYQGAS